MNKLLNIFLSASFIYFCFSINAYENHKKYDVVAVGEAMVDIVAFVSEDQLKLFEKEGIKKSDTSRINNLVTSDFLKNLKNYQIIPGVSEANVIANFASLGGKVGFNSIVANDQYGLLFKESLEKEKVDHLSKINIDPSKKTALCFTFITPDKDKTFAVSGDITSEIDDSYINYEAIKNSKLFYTDASDLDGGKNKSQITKKAFTVANENSVKTVFNLNNNFFINKNRAEIISLLPQIDILVGGESEKLRIYSKLNQLKKLSLKVYNMLI